MSKRAMQVMLIVLGFLAIIDVTHATRLLPQWLDDALGSAILYFVFYIFPFALAVGVGILIWELVKKVRK